ncbi:MAG: hypothetical protein CMD90_01000 [Gammaproteobacteria bacterium]|nr:hypothetical protein [Gammaproteobacteria bacterium]
MLKKIVIKLLNIFNLAIFRKRNADIIYLEDWETLNQDQNKIFQNYQKSLESSNSKKNNNLAKFSRFYLMSQFIELAIRNSVDNDNLAEVGVFKGHSARIIHNLIQQNNKKLYLHLFDSFEGLSDFGSKDKEDSVIKDDKSREEMKLFFKADAVSAVSLNELNNTIVYKGWVPSKFEKVKDKLFKFVHIDVDLYEPTLDSLKFFYPRLKEGGVIICDDYNSREFPGARKAWDEYFGNEYEDFFLTFPFGGCALVKKDKV